jgi:hypothetical protein
MWMALAVMTATAGNRSANSQYLTETFHRRSWLAHSRTLSPRALVTSPAARSGPNPPTTMNNVV